MQASYTYSKDLTDINYYSGGAVGANSTTRATWRSNTDRLTSTGRNA